MSNESQSQLKQAEKEDVVKYFNGTGFDRWNRIYSESEDVNKVQRNIRIGHQKTVDDVLSWIKESGDLSSMSFCDAGCGVGSLSLPLLSLGAGSIAASDISDSMVQETKRRTKFAGFDLDKISFNTSDLESLKGSFHTVICLDVFIHYPQKAAEEMVQHLCSLSKEKLIVSFAPYTPLLAILKTIGQFFPGPSKTTRAYILRESGIIKAAENNGFKVFRKKLNQAPFYFSQLIEFRKG
ncbi:MULTISPECIES: magnesium protoporphyrin IX methyltransferase [Prochlorococcus]|uniref:magnesium protoporphyrin IX methyltransferase n=1 Tax=Prochlorococcus TaxID=1218 RepID=UPI0005338231|nr:MULTISPECIES: magnesium protoporphyrin IX methyltransferase [Prochlorococcus]KGG13204.1 Mg-protoporphyrin O-methyltransferase [Prochlorococcus sp. MIT 0601]